MPGDLVDITANLAIFRCNLVQDGAVIYRPDRHFHLCGKHRLTDKLRLRKPQFFRLGIEYLPLFLIHPGMGNIGPQFGSVGRFLFHWRTRSFLSMVQSQEAYQNIDISRRRSIRFSIWKSLPVPIISISPYERGK